jgi:hypothetical protein
VLIAVTTISSVRARARGSRSSALVIVGVIIEV